MPEESWQSQHTTIFGIHQVAYAQDLGAGVESGRTSSSGASCRRFFRGPTVLGIEDAHPLMLDGIAGKEVEGARPGLTVVAHGPAREPVEPLVEAPLAAAA